MKGYDYHRGGPKASGPAGLIRPHPGQGRPRRSPLPAEAAGLSAKGLTDLGQAVELRAGQLEA